MDQQCASSYNVVQDANPFLKSHEYEYLLSSEKMIYFWKPLNKI